MKIFKGILYTVVIIILSFITAAFFAPSSILVERSIVINASQKNVFNQISDFTTWPHWDAWYSKDTNQTRRYVGRFGDSEYGYHWNSDDKHVGNGSMYFSSIVGMDSLIYDLSFENDDEITKASGYFHLSENEGETSVKWGMKSSLDFPYKILNYFMEEMVGKDFESGLENLKNYVEGNKINTSNEIVQIINEFGVDYALIRKDSLPMGEMNSFFRESYPIVYDYLRAKNIEPVGSSTGIYYDWDEENFITDLAAAVPISMSTPKDKKSVDFEFGEGFQTKNSISCELSGGYSKSYLAHMTINEWLTTNDKKMDGPVLEEYIKGPYDTKDSSKYLTRITYHFFNDSLE